MELLFSFHQSPRSYRNFQFSSKYQPIGIALNSSKKICFLAPKLWRTVVAHHESLLLNLALTALTSTTVGLRLGQ